MKAIIPAAGVGERLRPQTYSKPKALIELVGKPIIAHILDKLIGCIDTVIIIVGYMKDKLINYVEANYQNKLEIIYVEQTQRLGLGHAIYLTREVIGDDDEVLITLGDELFDMGYQQMLDHYKQVSNDCDALIGLKEVSDPTNYGIVELAGEYIKALEEKPSEPKTNLATAGVYLIKNTALLWKAFEDYVAIGKNDCKLTYGEYQLTDALMGMILFGGKLKYFKIDSWYDCGRPEMLLRVNRLLLDKTGLNVIQSENYEDTTFIKPVCVGTGCKIENSVIGPYVSISANTTIRNCVIRDSIIGSDAILDTIILDNSIIGDDVQIVGKSQQLNVGDKTSIVMH